MESCEEDIGSKEVLQQTNKQTNKQQQGDTSVVLRLVVSPDTSPRLTQ